MNLFSEYLTTVEVGDAVVAGNLAMFPLFANDNDKAGSVTPDILCFSDALAKDAVEVTEIGEGGSVPTLLFRNDADKPVFLLDGEQLVGAKQNRVVNLSLLLAAGATSEIPVSCVEAGRWSRRSRKFSGSRHMHYARGRREKMEQVSSSMRRTGTRRSDQGRVWDSIAAKREAFNADAPSEAMEDVYVSVAECMDNYERKLKRSPDQIGAVFAIDGEVCGFDLFADSGHLARYFEKLVGSHAIDAIESAGMKRRQGADQSDGGEDTAPSRDAVQAFLARFADAEEEEHEAIGLGKDLRIENDELVGAGLAWNDQFIHLAGFAKE